MTVSGDEQLSAAFQVHRDHLLRVAYATLGSVAEAEDVVQDAWLRLQRVPEPGAIRDLRAWLTTTVARLALDVLGSARVRREEYVGPWLPEPLVRPDMEHPADPANPADRVTLDEQVSLALLVALERLSPPERTAFLLHDVFGLSFDEVADVVGRSHATTRQLATRARRRVAEGRPRFPATRGEQQAIVAAFTQACAEGDLDQLVGLLRGDVIWRTDGGGKVNASQRPQRGAAKVARGMLALARRPPQAARLVDVNGAPGLLLRDADGVLTVIGFTVDQGLIASIDIVRNPDKLRAVPEPSAL